MSCFGVPVQTSNDTFVSASIGESYNIEKQHGVVLCLSRKFRRQMLFVCAFGLLLVEAGQIDVVR